MKKQLLFALMLFMAAVIYVSCTEGEVIPQTPPPGYTHVKNGNNGNDNGNGNNDDDNNGDDNNGDDNNGSPTDATSTIDEGVDMNEIRQQIDFPSELLLPNTGIVVALKAKQPGALNPQYFYPQNRGGYGMLHCDADWLRFECDREGIYFQASRYSATPATIKICRHSHPDEAIEFTVCVVREEPYQWSTDPAATNDKITFDYKGGRKTLKLINNFGCSLTEFFNYGPNWIKLINEAPLPNATGTTYTIDIEANRGDTQRNVKVDILSKSLTGSGFATCSEGSFTIVQDVALTLQKTATVDESNTIMLSYTNNTTSSIQWSSSNTSVATVTGNGVVRGVSGGTATITASVTEDGQTWSQSCRVTVRSAADIEVEVTSKVSLGVGIQNGRYGVFINNGLPGPITIDKLSASGATNFTATNLGTVDAGGTGFVAHSFYRGTTTITVYFTYQGRQYRTSTSLTLS